ncbi:MAG TPA: RNA polymerase factor sigma-32 [Candidatus Binatia bacterium]
MKTKEPGSPTPRSGARRERRAKGRKPAAARPVEPEVVEEEPEVVDEVEEVEPEVLDAGDVEILDAETVEPVDGAEPAAASDAEGSASGDRDSGGALVPTDPLQRYLAEIRRHPLLDPAEEHELAVRWREHGDRAAAMRLVTANLRLVVMIARQYQQAFKNLLDLIQEGNIGLLEAVKNFDPYRGVRFPSYAIWWIRAYIIRYVMNNWRLVKLGTTQAQRKLFFNLQREKDRLEREGFRPDPDLIAERLSVKRSEVIEMEQRLSGRDVSVDAPVGDGADATMLDFLSKGDDTEARVGEAEMRQLISEKIREFGETLRDKEKVIFDRRMVAEDPLTLQEIGEQYGISRERVRQIEERIRKRLRAYLVEQIPDISDVDVRMSLGGS